MNLGDPVGLARSHADNVHQDSDNTCTNNGEDEVVHTTSGGVSILAVAVEEHGSAVEHAGQQAEDVANHLLREFRSGGGQVEVQAEDVAADAEAEEALAEQHANEHDAEAYPLQRAHRLFTEDTSQQHADNRAGVDEHNGIGNGGHQR